MAKPRDTRGSIERMREHLSNGGRMQASSVLVGQGPTALSPTATQTSKTPSPGSSWNTTLYTSTEPPASSDSGSSSGSLRDTVDVDGGGYGFNDVTTPTQEALSKRVNVPGRVYTAQEYADGVNTRLPSRETKAPESSVTTLAAKQFEVRDVQVLPSSPDIAVALVAYDGACYWYFFGTPDSTPFESAPDDTYVIRGLVTRAPALPSYSTMSSRPEVQIRAVFEHLIQTSSAVVAAPQDGCDGIDVYAADEFNRTGQYPIPAGGEEAAPVRPPASPAAENLVRLGAIAAIAFFARMVNKD